jgi:hypothetical protein
MTDKPMDLEATPDTAYAEDWSQAVVTVGDGRGFVIAVDDDRYVLTAAHCLRQLPPAHAASLTWERTYRDILAPLGENPTLWAECLFVDPVADIAVLGQPDNQAFSEQADAYDDLVEALAAPLPLGALTFTRKRHIPSNGRAILLPPQAQAEVLLLALDGHWFAGRVNSTGKRLWLDGTAEGVQGGMSGSPIVTPDGAAIGLVSTNDLHPLLMDSLPGWLLR